MYIFDILYIEVEKISFEFLHKKKRIEILKKILYSTSTISNNYYFIDLKMQKNLRLFI